MQVLAICSGAGASNGGIMLDNLHLQRTGTPPEDIVRKIGRDVPLGVEINDGTLAMPVNLEDSVINKRLLPGDGEFDIDAFLHAVWTQGYDGPDRCRSAERVHPQMAPGDRGDRSICENAASRDAARARRQWEADSQRGMK